jgi:hypothetical protein
VKSRGRFLTSLSLLTVLAGCGAFVPIQSPDSVGPTVANTAASLPVLSADAAKGLKGLGEVVGYSCKNLLWDPAATPGAATLQVKLAAAQRGATAITAPSCSEGGVSLGTNCWQSYTCKATALRQ